MKLTIEKSFSLTESDLTMIDELLATGNYLSKSEVVRNCIRFAHKRQFPYYKVLGKNKEDEERAREKIKALPVEQYVREILGGDLKTKPGQCHMVHKNNPLHTVDIPLDIVKNYASRDEVWQSVGIMPEND